MAAVDQLRPLVVLMEEVENIVLHNTVVGEIATGQRGWGYYVRLHLSNAIYYGTPQYHHG